MNVDEYRREMWAYLEDAEARGREFKDPLYVERRLGRLYRAFDGSEQAMADCGIVRMGRIAGLSPFLNPLTIVGLVQT